MKKRMLVISSAALVAALLFVSGLIFGSVDLTPPEILRGLFTGEGKSGVIVRSLRLPRVTAALLSGMALATSGVLLQSATDNDLAAPNTVGINSGAGAAFMLSLCFFPDLYYLGGVFAFLGAILAAVLTLLIARATGEDMKRTSVVLSGVCVGALFGAVISYLSLRFPDALSSYAVFSVGGYAGIYMKELTLPLILIPTLTVMAFLLSGRLNLLALGDDLAGSLGARVGLLRTAAVTLAAALASVSVSFAGLVGFVGLIAPHISRRLVGSDKRYLIPMSAIVGASLTTLSDTLGRVLFSPTEMPSGIILSLVGAPFFLALLLGKRKGEYK